MFKKNDIIPLTIESITNEGSGIGHTDGIAVFVPMTAAGDELRVRIVKVQKSYCYGIIEEVITPSPDRVPVDCPSYKSCGGCSLRHITYEAELREKQRWVQDAMRRIGGFTIEPTAIRLSFPLGRAMQAAIPDFLRRAAILSFPAGTVPCSRWFSARSPHGCVIMPIPMGLPSTMNRQGKACYGIFICVRRPPMAALCFALSSMAIKCPMPRTSPGKHNSSSLPSPPYC